MNTPGRFQLKAEKALAAVNAEGGVFTRIPGLPITWPGGEASRICRLRRNY